MNKRSSWLLWLAIAAGCGTSGPATPSDAGSGDGATPSADAAMPNSDGGTPRCNEIPTAPVNFTVKNGPIAVEDFAFTADGRMVGHDGEGNLVRSTFDGQVQVFVPQASDHVSGILQLPDGNLIFADSSVGALVKVAPSGGRETLLSSLDYPNGLAFGPDEHIYVAEQTAGQVRRVHPETGEFTIVARGIWEPNGVAFDAGRTLYIGSFGTGRVYRTTIAADGTASDVQLFATVPDAPALNPDGSPIIPGFEGDPSDEVPPEGETGGLDGVGVDACGYVYVTEFVRGIVWRITPDGQTVEKLIEPGTQWVPNMHWGNGVGGWDRNTLYVIDAEPSKMYVVPLGIGAAR